MNDFAKLWEQQMNDPKMRAMMEATNDLIGRPQDGSKCLSQMNLTDEERDRILKIMSDPRFQKAEDAIILQFCGRTKLVKRIGALRARRYRATFQRSAKDSQLFRKHGR